jgi:hypothetical protein
MALVDGMAYRDQVTESVSQNPLIWLHAILFKPYKLIQVFVIVHVSQKTHYY